MSSQLVAAQFTRSIRDKPILVDSNQYEYKLKRGPVNGRNSWECRKKDAEHCKAVATTILLDGVEYIEKLKGEHVHSSQILHKRIEKVQRAAIENAAKNPTLPCRAVLADLSNTLQTDSLAAAASMDKLSTLKQRIYRARKANLDEDKLPTSAEELLNLPEKYTKLDSGENFLISAVKLSEADDVAMIFQSGFGKHILETSDEWFMDGTFATVPEQFGQLYIVMGLQHDKLFPGAYLLLPNKQSKTYAHAIDVIKDHIENSPKSINIDFEQAVVRTLARKYPGSDIFGCNFHWKKRIFDNVKAKNCLHLFNTSEQFQIGLDLVYVLCYVPPGDVVQAFETVVLPFFHEHFYKATDSDDEEDWSQEIDNFLCYMERTYIGKINSVNNIRSKPYFAISMWNLYDRIVGDKQCTNNGVKSWNARWTNTLGTNHNLYRVVSAFKKEDSLARQKFHEVVSGRSTEPNPSRKDRKTCRMKQLKDALLKFDKENLKTFMFGIIEN